LIIEPKNTAVSLIFPATYRKPIRRHQSPAHRPERARPAPGRPGHLGGKFGCTLHAQGGNGRDPNNKAFTLWMADGGVKGGFSHGLTDDYGYGAIEDKMHVHDLHATILHLLGLDHERLAYGDVGWDFRLTDVHGHAVKQIMA
jgi:hypothetical protein